MSDMTNRSLLEMVVLPQRSCSMEQATVTGGHVSELHPFSFSKYALHCRVIETVGLCRLLPLHVPGNENFDALG